VKLRHLIQPLLVALIAATCAFALAAPASAQSNTDRALSAKTSKAETKANKGDSYENGKLDLGDADTGSGAKAESSKKSGNGGAIGRMLFGLVFVVGVIYAVHWLLKNYNKSKFGDRAGGASSAIEVVATTPLAAGRMLHVVRVGGEYLLLGATDSSITNLRSLDPSMSTHSPEGTASAEFQGRLANAIGGGDVATESPNVAALVADKKFMGRVVMNLQAMTAR
jgi:flagellar biosynthetic protein FliO